MREDHDMTYDQQIEDDIDIQMQDQEDDERPAWTDLTNTMKEIHDLLADLSEVLHGQRQQVLNLDAIIKDLPKEMDKLKTACAQAECICQELPHKVQNDSLKIYEQTLRQAQKNCNTFAKQVDTWLQKREAKQSQKSVRDRWLILSLLVLIVILQFVSLIM